MKPAILTTLLVPCRGCGDPFLPTRPNNIYCHLKCKRRSNSRRRSKRRDPGYVAACRDRARRKAGLVLHAVTCPACGSVFETYRNRKKFCNDVCAAAPKSKWPKRVASEFWTPERQAELKRLWGLAKMAFDQGAARKKAISEAMKAMVRG